MGFTKKKLLKKLCHCIKQVRKIKPESGAIGICVSSVLHRRGKTIKRFSCKKKQITLKNKSI
jgi:hypothetical protein